MTSGDRCPKCDHYLTVVDTVMRGKMRVQYLGCRKPRGCGYRPPDNRRVLRGDEPTPRMVTR